MKTRARIDVQETRSTPVFRGECRRKVSGETVMTFTCVLLLMAVSGPAVAKGKPGGGGGVDLGVPAEGLGLPQGCSSAADVFAHGIGDDGPSASTASVAAGIQGCDSGSPPRPFLWSNGTWQAVDVLAGQAGGEAQDVSEAGVVVGNTSGNPGTAFAQRPGADVEVLPKGGYYHSNAYDVSNNGRFVAGGLDVQGEDSGNAALWSWNGSAWSLRVLGEGWASSVSEDGTLLAGTAKLNDGRSHAVLWRAGTAQPIDLGLSSEYGLHAIAPGGDLVVGFRWASCARKRNPDCRYEVPVFWTRDEATGSWFPTELQALDGVDSEAEAVADVIGRGLVIVGYGFTKADKVMRAVTWIPRADGSYGAPIRLAPLGGDPATHARANAVNSYGVVLGTSSIVGKGLRVDHRASIWILP